MRVDNLSRVTRHRPRIELLEARLAPGEAVLGLLFTWPNATPGSDDRLNFSICKPCFRCEAILPTEPVVVSSTPETPNVTTRAIDEEFKPLIRESPALTNSGLTFEPSRSSTTASASHPALGIFISSEVNPTAASLIHSRVQPAFSTVSGISAGTPREPQSQTVRSESKILDTYGKLPLSFEANEGQTDESVDFLARAASYTLFLTPTEAVMSFQGSQLPDRRAGGVNPLESASLQGVNTPRSPDAVVLMQLIGADPAAKAAGVNPLETKVNYFLGADPNHWHTNISTFAKVGYDDVYPGIDLVYYGKDQQLEYDFIVSPGADPRAIALNFAGANGLEINTQGDLVLHTPAGDVIQRKPFIYQEANGARQLVAGEFRIQNSEYRIQHARFVDDSSFIFHPSSFQTLVTFEVGAYDTSRPLVIDPLVLSYSTYLGGGLGGETGYGIAVDGAGAAYVTGETFATDFPAKPGAFDTSYNGSTDAFVAKLNPAGSALEYCTFLGGAGDDSGSGITVDSGGNAYLAGMTNSTGFPTTAGAFDTTFSGTDGFVTKLNATGSALSYSTFLGGASSIGGIAVDGSGSAHVSGSTSAATFPTTVGAFDTSNNGGDAFAVMLNPSGSAYVYSTFLGGGSNETGNGIALDVTGNAYVTGRTNSVDFPTTAGALDTTYNGGDHDVYVIKLNVDGTAVAYGTYLGGGSSDDGQAISVDGGGNVYVTGSTNSSGFPTTAGAFDTTFGGDFDVFLAKVHASGTSLTYSTFLGGFSLDIGFAIGIDGSGNAYVTGRTDSSNFPTTAGAFDTTFNGGTIDTYLTKVNAGGTALVYSTYMGGNNFDLGYGIAVRSDGDSYVTGTSSSTNFPTTPGALKRRNRGFGDAVVTKFTEI